MMKGQTKEAIGFYVEVMFFVLAGAIGNYNILVGVIFLILGGVVAVIVGKQIAKNAIDKFKEENKWT